MPREKTSVRKVKEILRLGLKEGRSQREIAQSTGVSKTTVQEVLSKTRAAGLDWAALGTMREYEILEKVVYPGVSGGAPKRPLPNWAAIRADLLKKGNTLALLWMDYKEAQPDGLQYSRFCELYRNWEKQSRLVLRHNHVAGDKLFVDFSGLTVPWLDLATNTVRNAEVFVAVLGASNFTFAKAAADQTLKSWIDLHVDAFAFFGGVPQAVVPDNLRSGVSKACRYDPESNPSYLALAEHYDTAVVPARARKPRDKAKAEVGVQVVQRWILARLRRMTFTSIEQINVAIEPLLLKLNNRVMRHLGVSRQELFDRYEKSALRTLPDEPFEMASWKLAKVNIDYHVEFGRQYYSVPYRFVGSEVRIKVTRSLVQIFHEDDCIASHKRSNAPIPGRFTTLTEHMPPQHAEHVKWTPERILSWAQRSGPATRQLCERVIASRKLPEQGFRSCLGILRLGERYDQTRLEAACEAALKMRSVNYRTIEELLKKGAFSDRNSKTPTPILLDHENIRGSSYYQ
jgi:transposase